MTGDDVAPRRTREGTPDCPLDGGESPLAPSPGVDLESDAESIALAGRVKAERAYVGLSQAQVAEVLGVPRAAVSAVETGRRRVSSLELKKLADLFGTTGDRLLGREVEEDATVTALFRTTKALTETDRQQVLRFAEFLRGAGSAPKVNLEADDA